MKAWRRTEPKTARPFFAASNIEGLLDATSILVGDRELEIEEESVQLDPADFEDLHVALLPRIDRDLLNVTLAGRETHYEFIMTLRDPMFKRRVLHKAWPVSDALPDRLVLDQETIQEFGHKRELAVSLALVLMSDVDEPTPGWPSKKGAWIAKKTFKIRLRSIRSTFDLRPMTKEFASDHTGSSGALLHVEVDVDRFTLELEEGSPLATVWIAEDVYNAMQRTTDGNALQGVIMPEVIYSVLAIAAEEIQEIEEVPKGTPLETILEQLGESLPLSLGQLKTIVLDPIRLKALIHDRTSYVDLLRSL